MNPFEYERATDPTRAVAAVSSDPGAAFLAGGTNLVDLMKLGVAQPDRLVDISGLPFNRIEPLPGGGLRVGALVRNSDLAADAAVRRRYPMLAQAVLSGASGQLRNAATVGGNLLQRTRCVYFQDVTKPCNKREPGTGCPARAGYHRGLAILGGSPGCIATHPSDMAVALAALGAVVHVRGPDGDRTVPATELHRLPGGDPERDTVLSRAELITWVEVPSLSFGSCSRYRKVSDRASYAFALVSVAAALDIDGGVAQDVRLALGGVAPKPWRAWKAEEILRGAPISRRLLMQAADAELADAEPLDGNTFKVLLARRLIVGTLLDLAGLPSDRANR